MAKNCWLDLTPFQLACVLILIVAVTFFIVMVFTYVLFSLVWSQSEQCGNLCCSLNIQRSRASDRSRKGETIIPRPEYESQEKDGADTTSESVSTVGSDTSPESSTNPRSSTNPNKDSSSTATTTKSEENTEKPKSESSSQKNDREQRHLKTFPGYTTESLEENLHVAALLEKLHVDDKSYYFKCTAAVILDGWALTTARCAKKGISAIRLSSKYWSKGGIFLQIDNVLYSKGKELLALVHFMETGGYGAMIKPFWGSTKVLTYDWKGKLDLPLFERKKYNALEISEKKPERNVSCSKYEKKDVLCFVINKGECEDDVNAPIFDETLHLIGFHLETLRPENVNYFVVVYIDVYSFKVWLYESLGINIDE